MNFRFLSTLRSRLFPGSGSKSGNSVGAVLQAFLNAPSMEEKRTMLHARPELLEPKAESLLSYNAGLEENKLQRPRFEQHRLLLDLCRTLGIDAACTPIPATPAGTPLGFVLQAFMNTPTLDQKKALLKAHPELLNSDCAELLRRGKDERTQQALGQHAQLFELCRKLGIDAAFAEAARRARHPDGQAVVRKIIEVIGARSLMEMEAAIREEPRVLDRDFRESFKTLRALSGVAGLTSGRIRAGLDVLEACERNGIAATFRSLNKAFAGAPEGWMARETKLPAVSAPDRDKAFNELIRKFEAGHSVSELATEANALIPDLPMLPRRACMVLAMICSSRAGDAMQARRWAVRLNAGARDWGVPGLPSRSVGPAVLESTDFDPIVDTLHWLARGGQGTAQEQDAIRSLLIRYAAGKKAVSSR